jgi:predicted kinase
MPESTLYIMCGLPFSGKTTLAHVLANQCGFVHLDLDALARAKGIFPEEGIDDKQWGLLFGEAYQHLAVLLASGKSVVFDAVNSQGAGRDHLRTIAQQNGSSVFVIYVNLSIQEIEQRRQANQDNHQRSHVRDKDFTELAKDFEIPTAEENLLIYDGVQSMTEWIKHYVLGVIQP